MPKRSEDRHGNVTVWFSPEEMARFEHLAEGRFLPKRAAGIDRGFIPPQDGVANDLLGIMGEAAVGDLLGTGFDETISLSGDGGVVDLEKDGITVQVKTTWYSTGRLLFNHAVHFQADLAVLVIKVADTAVRIAGWIPREEFLAICESADFNYGRRAYVEQSDLYPPHSLGLYIEKKKSENEARRIEFEERAAIMEFDGGLTRADAERAARADIANTRR